MLSVTLQEFGDLPLRLFLAEPLEARGGQGRSRKVKKSAQPPLSWARQKTIMQAEQKDTANNPEGTSRGQGGQGRPWEAKKSMQPDRD